MVFPILRGFLPCSNDWNILECKWMYGMYGSYCVSHCQLFCWIGVGQTNEPCLRHERSLLNDWLTSLQRVCKHSYLSIRSFSVAAHAPWLGGRELHIWGVPPKCCDKRKCFVWNQTFCRDMKPWRVPRWAHKEHILTGFVILFVNILTVFPHMSDMFLEFLSSPSWYPWDILLTWQT